MSLLTWLGLSFLPGKSKILSAGIVFASIRGGGGGPLTLGPSPGGKFPLGAPK